MPIPSKNILPKYDNLKWDISDRYRKLSILDTNENKVLIIDGVRCLLLSGLYKGLDIEFIEGNLKKEIINDINSFMKEIKNGDNNKNDDD